MEFFKFLIIGIVCIAVYSLVLCLLGHWARRSKFGKLVSVIFIVVSVLALFAAYFVRANIGKMTVQIENGLVKGIKKIDLSASISLEKYRQQKDTLIVYDVKGHEFFARVPSTVTGQVGEVRLLPSSVFIFSPKFAIARVSDWYVVATWDKLFAFLMSWLAVMGVWCAGTEGKFAYLLPSHD
jgi:hypothetical protein